MSSINYFVIIGFFLTNLSHLSASPESSVLKGVLIEKNKFSPTLNRELSYILYLPPGFDAVANAPHAVLYLLHGRGDCMAAWKTIKSDLDQLILANKIPPIIAIMPDLTGSLRAGYYINSQFTGSEEQKLPPGEEIETALIHDLLNHIDTAYSVYPDRSARIIAGYSMGGYGALRLALAYPHLFGAAIVLSPAVYNPLPPRNSSTREFGAFGLGENVFDELIYTNLNYPTLIPIFESTGLPLFMFIAVGDDETALNDPEEARHDLDYEAHTLYNKIRRVKRITSEFRVVDGGHNWETWRPTFIEAIQSVFSEPLLIIPKKNK